MVLKFNCWSEFHYSSGSFAPFTTIRLRLVSMWKEISTQWKYFMPLSDALDIFFKHLRMMEVETCLIIFAMMTSSNGNIFLRNWPFVRGIHRSPVNSPHKGQWRGALMFSLICAWINGWVSNCKAGDLRRHRAHYDVIVMTLWSYDCADRQYPIFC